MQHLTPVGLTEDGKDVVLTSPTGEEFSVPADDLRATLGEAANEEKPAERKDQGHGFAQPVRRGQEMRMESALRPRDIQARIRSGETPEAVAAAAQTTVDGIMAFAAPVLAERAHVAATAVKSSIRRATTEASPVARTLDDASRQYFSTVSVRADDVEWDAWRREDGRWNLVGTYVVRGTEHRAEFTYDMPGRYVLADNDDARLLTGESVPTPAAPEPTRRLSAVPSGDVDELPLGDDALELVRERDDEPDESSVNTSDLSETVAAVRQSAPVHEPASQPTDDPIADHADADWIAEVPAEPAREPEPVHETISFFEPELEPEPEPEPTPEPVHVREREPASYDETFDETDPLPVEEPEAPAAETPAPKKKGRSSVPSWDEIMFGGGKHE
ncbi:hypothetical protein ABIE44_000186 [Marmoricola sp. OAE513]|uniref:septation protein SepH n=1 Tax=Marmoricola sp. OAE513 TaxID=2817894 RepID=UPI001AE88C69